ncbi:MULTISPECIES: DUF2808 domain-containing protein [unclassified Prochlorococcus]|uniref:DUF2808 domain-containing protein n=1 Tax=unclassified Prochlorococcus TaxID=2627481 RepID=UPI000533853E|nr:MULTISPECIES: DUF2808 domain-containing protein [unclassified Prochlorococcus]KGG17894.1 hypothetical protein EV06_0017 [Prochlorococcus sp. MIT 0602]
MRQISNNSTFKNSAKKLLSSSLAIGALFAIGTIPNNPSLANTGIDFMWDPDPNYVRLKYVQSSKEKRDRSTYYLILRSKNRKTGILKLTIKVPDYFESKIKPEKLEFCRAQVGGYSTRTKCLETIPGIIEVSKDQTAIDFYPDQPIPVDKKSYALRMKIFNPNSAGMFQFHAYAQSPGAVPISGYVGSWNIAIE